MKTQNQVRITNENVRITEQNVQHLGECIALSAIKKMMRFAHHPRSLDNHTARKYLKNSCWIALSPN